MLQQAFEPDKDDGAAADDHHDPLAGQGAEADADQHADGGGRRRDHPHGEGGNPDAGTGERQPCSHCQRIQTGGDCRQKEGARREEIRRAAGLRAILSRLLLLFPEPFENHFSADESEQREGEPVVHGADHVLQQCGRGKSEERHEDLKAAEKEGGPGGVADLSAGAVAEGAAHRDGERVDGDAYRNQKNRNERHGVTSSASP